jgi:hypothetical protein
MMLWVSNSKLSPKLISKQFEKDFDEFLAVPSAMFDGIETLDLLI